MPKLTGVNDFDVCVCVCGCADGSSLEVTHRARAGSLEGTGSFQGSFRGLPAADTASKAEVAELKKDIADLKRQVASLVDIIRSFQGSGVGVGASTGESSLQEFKRE